MGCLPDSLEIVKTLGGFLTGLAALIAVLKNPPKGKHRK